MNLNMDQIRAETAYLVAKDNQKKEFQQSAMKLADMLQTNGLLATWAFLLAKKEKILISSLHSYLMSRFKTLFTDDSPEDFASSINRFEIWIGQNGLSSLQLRQLTSEAIEFAGWLKRAVKAYAK
jgi:CRISPR type III-B/RAMP module-associated protein Cmr5